MSVAYQVQIRPINPSATGMSDSRPGIARDLSRGGIGILVDYPFQVPSRLLVTFETEYGTEKRVISRLGSVAWITPQPTDGSCRIGIRFSDEDEDQ